MASFSCVSYHENSIRKYGIHYDLFNYTTNIIDSTVKSCLNCHDPHLIFDDEPYKDTLRGTKSQVHNPV